MAQQATVTLVEKPELIDKYINGPITVITSHTVYRFSAPNDLGERNVSRDGKDLDFEICRITFLKEGSRMELMRKDKISPWLTSRVKSIAAMMLTVNIFMGSDFKKCRALFIDYFIKQSYNHFINFKLIN